ncbi:MAG: ABC transporter substrate-binding protein [Chloroflexi bacterium]|nr:ABC transporter substrate-binding protein [Chloroflexota bacterium]
MATRREFLTSLFGVGALGLVAACGGGGSQTPATSTSAAPKPGATTAVAPAQTAPAQAASKPAASGGTITFVIENDVIDFDPMLSRAFVDRNAQYQIYDSLVRVDPSGKIIPWLADKWDVSADGKQVTFSLRKDVKYHDGTPFDAESVKWNIDRYRTTDGSARKGELAPVASVDVVDASTVRFNLTATFAPLLSLLVDRAGMMVSRKVVEASGQDFTRKAFKAGTGPFVLTEAIKDDHVTLEKNPDWWGTDSAGNKLPFLDKIIIKPITNSDVRLTNLKTGDAQFCNNVSPKDVAAVKTDSTMRPAVLRVPGSIWRSRADPTGTAVPGAAAQSRYRRSDFAARVRSDLAAAERAHVQRHHLRRLERSRRSGWQHVRLQLHGAAAQRQQLLQPNRRQVPRRAAAGDRRSQTQRRVAQG